MGGGSSRENKCERKILNDQNSSHKTLGLMPGLLLGAADKAVPAAKHVAS